MALDLPATFTALGHIYYPLLRSHQYTAGNLSTSVDGAVSALGTGNADIAGPLQAAKEGWQGQASAAVGSAVQNAAAAYLLRTVNADNPQSDRTNVQIALIELVRQMKAQAYYVSPVTVAASAAALSTNVGNGAVVLTTKRADGLTQQAIYAEVGSLLCTGDGQAGTATSGSEPFSYRGDYAPADVMAFSWPGYSGGAASLTAIDAGGSANLLANGDFEDFTTANTPDNWTIGAGGAGVSIFSEAGAGLFYAGAKAVKFLGTGAVRPILRQTLTTLRPNRVYGVACWVRASGTLTTAANLKIRLVDGSNATITDDQTAENGITQDLTTLTTSFVAKTGVLITPKTLPSTVKLQIEASNGANLVSSEAVYLDSLSLSEVAFAYPGGFGMGVFSGSTPFMTGDGWDVTTTNNQNGASYGATWSRVFQRLFNTTAYQIILPYSGSTLLADALLA